MHESDIRALKEDFRDVGLTLVGALIAAGAMLLLVQTIEKLARADITNSDLQEHYCPDSSTHAHPNLPERSLPSGEFYKIIDSPALA